MLISWVELFYLSTIYPHMGVSTPASYGVSLWLKLAILFTGKDLGGDLAGEKMLCCRRIVTKVLQVLSMNLLEESWTQAICSGLVSAGTTR